MPDCVARRLSQHLYVLAGKSTVIVSAYSAEIAHGMPTFSRNRSHPACSLARALHLVLERREHILHIIQILCEWKVMKMVERAIPDLLQCGLIPESLLYLQKIGHWTAIL